MKSSLAGAITAAACRAIAIVAAGVALCASLLGAVGFALVALYSTLTPSLGPVYAAFATSGIALAIPVIVTIGVLIVTRSGTAEGRAEAAAELGHATAAEQPTPTHRSGGGIDQALEWITSNPRTATLGALSLGVALGASPDLRKTVLHGVDTALSQSRSQLH